MSNYTPEYRETSGVGRRKLMTMDEVLRMDVDRALVIIRGKKVLEVDKYDYSKHPEAKKLRPSKAASHVPAWRKADDGQQTTPKPSAKKSPARGTKKRADTEKAAPPPKMSGQGAQKPEAVSPPAEGQGTERPKPRPASKPKIISATKDSILSKPTVNKED